MTTLEIEPRQHAEELRDAAVELAAAKFYVIRCRPGEKLPLQGDEWKTSMTADAAAVRQLWTSGAGTAQNLNIGVVCMPSNVFVLDVDGEQGEQALAALEDQHGRLPLTATCRTPGRGGGRHLYFRAVEGLQMLPRIATGLDIKHNGYVLAPPSVHPEGGIYRWERRMLPADPPSWLVDLATRRVYDDMPEREHTPSQVDGLWERIEDWFDANFTCQDVMVRALSEMRGWQYAGVQAGNHSYVRPGKTVRQGISLVIYKYSHTPARQCRNHSSNRCEDCAYTRAQMFSTADPDTPAGTYGAWRLLVHVLFADDYNTAKAKIFTEGFQGRYWERPAPSKPTDLAAMLVPRNGIRPKFMAVAASTIVALRKEWVIPHLVPKAELTLVTGKPGGGKSFFVTDIVARLSRGDEHPAGPSCIGGPAKILMLTGEDDMASVIIPRLQAAKADLSRVMVNGRVAGVDGEFSNWSMAYLVELEESILEEGYNLLVFDVIKQFMRHRDDNAELEVRRELQPLVDLCHRTGVTVIGVRHTRKNPLSAESAGAGSQAYYALCRSELLITQEVDHDGTKVSTLTVNKSSYGEGGKRSEFQIMSSDVVVRNPDGTDGNDRVGHVAWRQGWTNAVDPDDVLAPKSERVQDRVYREAAIRTLRGAAALEYELDVNDYRRICLEKLDEMEWEGGRSQATLLAWERKMTQAGIITKRVLHRGAPYGNVSIISLVEQFREEVVPS